MMKVTVVLDQSVEFSREKILDRDVVISPITRQVRIEINDTCYRLEFDQFEKGIKINKIGSVGSGQIQVLPGLSNVITIK